MEYIVSIPQDAVSDMRRKYVGSEAVSKSQPTRFLKIKEVEAGRVVYNFTVVKDNPDTFINLYGVCVGLNTGNVALGLFPRSEEYVKVSNIHEVLKNILFNNPKFDIDLDIKYIIELLKIHPIKYKKDISDYILSELTEKDDKNAPKSICLRYMLEKSRKEMNTKEGIYFFDLYKNNMVVDRIGMWLDNLKWDLQWLFSELYPITGLDIYFDYERLGLCSTVQHELLSRSFYKQSTNLIVKQMCFPKTSNYFSTEFNNDEVYLAFSFMNIARSTGWEQNVIFGLESLVSFNTTKVLDKVLDKFNIPSILKDLGLSLKEFVKGLDKYRREVLPHMDMQSKFVNYNDPIKAQYQVYEFSKVLEQSMSMIKKNINSN